MIGKLGTASGKSWNQLLRHAMLGVALGGVALVVAPLLAQQGPTEKQGTWWKFTSLGFKFEGAETCAGSNCHGGGNADFPPEKPGSENTIWSTHDKHAKAASIITKPDLDKSPWMKDIAAKLNIQGDLLTSAKCVSCHTSTVPDNLKGDKYNVNEGVSCYHCHGPSEKWRQPHAEKGWTQKMRDGMDHDKLLADWGLYDTKSVMHRTEMCASCHLSIDGDLVKAGHPQPVFEQATFQMNEPQHWVDPSGYYTTKLWSAGQIIALRDSMQQLAARAGGDAELAKKAYDQAMTHLAMTKAILSAKVVAGDVAALDNAAKGLAGGPDAAAAAEVAKVADGLKLKINDAAPDKAQTLALVTAISGQGDLVKQHGRRAAEQVYFALYQLYGAGYASAEGVSDDDYNKVADLLAPLNDQVPLEEIEKPIDPAKFTADLAKIADAMKALK